MKQPPKDVQCDAFIGVDYSSYSPKILRCKNKATVVSKTKLLGMPVWLCEDCEKLVPSESN